MLKSGFLFFTTFVVTLCLFSQEADARISKLASRVLGIITKTSAKSAPRIIDLYPSNSSIGPSKYSVEEVFRLLTRDPKNSGNIFNTEELKNLVEPLGPRKKISIRKLLESLDSEPANESKIEEGEFIVGLIARNENGALLHIRSDRFVEAYGSVKQNKDCKVDGSICLTYGTKPKSSFKAPKPEASFKAQCGDHSLTISTSGSLSIKFDGHSSSISMSVETN